MKKRLDELKDWCKDIGSFATDMHVCSVVERNRTGLVSLEIAIDAVGRELLEENNLIQTVSFQVVSVSSKK